MKTRLLQKRAWPRRIGCTDGSIEFPKLRLWQDAQGGEGDWSKPLKANDIPMQKVAPLQKQLTHFCDLITERETQPKVSGQDGLAALELVDAILRAVKRDGPVYLADRQTHHAA